MSLQHGDVILAQFSGAIAPRV